MKKMMSRTFQVFILLLSFVITAWSNGSTLKVPTNKIDYADTANWLNIADPQYDVDVFYLYPTCWTATEEDGLVNNIDNASMRKGAHKMYHEQATCFEGFANIYAPYYRQGSLMPLIEGRVKGQQEVIGGVPYQDAVAAFEYYLKNYNNGRPFILAGHSQGSSVLKKLLADYMVEHPDVYERMIVAYPIGYSFEQSYFDKNKHLKFAEGEDDTQVVVTWNSEIQKDGKLGTFNAVCDEGALSINPISWKHDYEKVEANDPRNLGSFEDSNEHYSTQVMYDPVRKYEVLISGRGDMRSDIAFMGDQTLHGYDFAMYYNNIRENAKKRIESYKKKVATE